MSQSLDRIKRSRSEFLGQGIGNANNRNFFSAVSVACYGHTGAVGQLVLQFYRLISTNTENLRRFAVLLKCKNSKLKDLCKRSAVLE